MSDATTFLTGLGATLVVTLVVVIYLRPNLRKILIDLCGTQERGEFWTAFSNVTLVLIPLICAMFSPPRSDADASVLFEISGQLRWALIGLVGTVVMLGVVLSRFIPRRSSEQQPESELPWRGTDSRPDRGPGPGRGS